jgi:hypothetical protein
VQYVMIIAGDEGHWYDDAVATGLMDEVNSWWDKWHQAGKIVSGGAELQHSRTAKTIAAGPGGEPTVTDGPYLEIKEVVGGFILIEADDVDEAISVAAGWPGIRMGDRIEVRPVVER